MPLASFFNFPYIIHCSFCFNSVVYCLTSLGSLSSGSPQPRSVLLVSLLDTQGNQFGIKFIPCNAADTSFPSAILEKYETMAEKHLLPFSSSYYQLKPFRTHSQSGQNIFFKALCHTSILCSWPLDVETRHTRSRRDVIEEKEKQYTRITPSSYCTEFSFSLQVHFIGNTLSVPGCSLLSIITISQKYWRKKHAQKAEPPQKVTLSLNSFMKTIVCYIKSTFSILHDLHSKSHLSLNDPWLISSLSHKYPQTN